MSGTAPRPRPRPITGPTDDPVDNPVGAPADAPLGWQWVQAQAQARAGLRIASPNPRVGCVIEDAAGRLLGCGHTQAAGGPHAEVMALRDAAARSHDVRGATVYVTLEPCSHQGRTPPCTQALMAAGIGQVVIAALDPNPLVNGRGVAQLRAAGVAVQVLAQDGPEARAARELNIGFFSRMTRGRPWVRMKVAASLDGKTALENGASQWITGPAARADGHAWRARACAVLTGIGTLLHDNPRLDARQPDAPRQPHLVVLDSRLQTPPDAALWSTLTTPTTNAAPLPRPRQVWIYTASADAGRAQVLQALGAEVIALPNAQGQVDLAAMLADLARREINELHVEAGYRLNGALMRAGLVDEWLVYLAPKLIGAGRDMAQWGPALQHLSQALPLVFESAQPVGQDLRIVARVQGRDEFVRGRS